MRKKLTLLLIFICCNFVLLSQVHDINAGARSSGMANASVTLQDVWSVFNNPAGLAGVENTTLGLFYENRFGLKETGYGSVAFSSPFAGGSFGFGFSNFGYSLFQTNKFGIAYAQQLFSSVAMGVQIDYFSILQSEYYGNLHALTFDIGILAKPTDEFSIGFHAFNPLNLSYLSDLDGEKLPVILKLGLSYLFSKNLLIAIETSKALNAQVPVAILGFEYNFNRNLVLRTGVVFEDPIEYSFGLGYLFSNVQFDLGFHYHRILGASPNVSFNYAF